MAATPHQRLNLILGTANVGDSSKDPMVRYDTPEQVRLYLDTFRERGYNHLDTSRIYAAHAMGSSEPRLGAVNAGDNFIIDTKVNSRLEGGHSKANILQEIDASLAALKMSQVNTLYLHLPDRETPMKETCEGLDKAYREGKFKKWGICNLTAHEVQKFIDVCQENGFIKPSVYQGQYNAIVRGSEKELFQVLRKNEMPFYAYSPAAAGFFAGNHKEDRAGSRFDSKLLLGGLYSAFYLKPAIMAATDKALHIASQHGISGQAAALRWVAHHSALKPELGDSILFAASSIAQLKENLDNFEAGPLPADLVSALEAIYGAVGEDEVAYHM